MRFVSFLNEDYYGVAPGGNKVFINPSSGELRTWSTEDKFGGVPLRSVRFIIDDNSKDVYVGDRYLYHPEFFKYLKGLRKLNKYDCFMGSGIIENSKITIDTLSYEMALPKKLARFQWASKYFNNLEKYLGIA